MAGHLTLALDVLQQTGHAAGPPLADGVQANGQQGVLYKGVVEPVDDRARKGPQVLQGQSRVGITSSKMVSFMKVRTRSSSMHSRTISCPMR